MVNKTKKTDGKETSGSARGGKSKDSRANLLLKNGAQLFDIFLEASEDLIFILDAEGCFLTINDFGSAVLDYEPGELIGVHFTELISAEDRDNVAVAFQKLLKDAELVSFESRLMSKFGNEVIIEFNGKSVREGGNLMGMLAFGRNVTDIRYYENKISDLNNRLKEANRLIQIERQRSKRQKAILYELNRMKSEFVSNISHELRTPLASIIGFSETIASDPEMPLEMRLEFNDVILNEGKRLAKLINDVLDLSRLESGKIELNKSEFDIVELLKGVIDANMKNMNAKQISFSPELPEEPVILNADRERISQVINGLLNNAVKFTGENGRITLSAQSLYKEFEITISDTGVGIPKDDLPYIFQKFYRVSRPGSEIPGTGLGLVFVKQIVDLHRGFIEVQSEINEGTTVILKFPKHSKV